MSLQENIVNIRFHYDGDYLDEIVESIGISPNLLRVKGERTNGIGPIHKLNGFEIATGLDKNVSIEKQIKKLCQILKPIEANIIRVKNQLQGNLEFNLIQYTNEANTGFHLDKEFVELLNKLGAEVDVDIYSLPKD